MLFPAVEPPDQLTVQMTSDGEVYADKNGMTVYAFYCFDEAPDHLPCDIPGTPQQYRLSICGGPEKCAELWRPVTASENAEPVGNTWTIVEVDKSGKALFAADNPDAEPLNVWAYKGRPLFTYSKDQMPGDITGDKVGHLVDWGYWMIKK